jgi:uncharacterized protein (TIGR02246 family)
MMLLGGTKQMSKLCLVGIVIAMIGVALGQATNKTAEPRRFWNEQDATAIRALLEEGFETDWNNHQPALAATPDKCADDAIFINTTGGWLIGCQKWAELTTRLHAPRGPFHDHTRRHAVEELRFLRPDVAIAVVKTFDIKHGGVPTSGEDTRGLIVLSKEDGHWKVQALANARISATPQGNR